MKEANLSLIVAMDQNRLIGANNGLPWHLPDDMKWFVDKTLGKPVIMGRKTYDSIPAKYKPLKERHNIIVTRNDDYRAEGCTVVHSIETALAAAGNVPEIIIGGGTQIYAQMLPIASRLYLTLVEGAFEGDAYFPEFDQSAWRETFRWHHLADSRHAVPFTWVILEK